jgi:hypothetical protein
VSISASGFESGALRLQHRGVYCVVWIHTDRPGTSALRVSLAFNSSETTRWATGPSQDSACAAGSSYVHVGNDPYRVDELSVTSYRFCGDDVIPPPIVSRGDRLWVAYSNLSLHLTLSYRILPKGRRW